MIYKTEFTIYLSEEIDGREGKAISMENRNLIMFSHSFLELCTEIYFKENSRRKETDLSTEFKKAVEKHAQILHF